MAPATATYEQGAIMTGYHKILVPTDFSPHSAEAIRHAAVICRHYEASVDLIHVYNPIYYPLPDGYVLYSAGQLSALLSTFDKQLAQSKEEALAAGATEVTTKLLQGVPAQEIVSQAVGGGYDLIVMGTHGRTGFQHALVGSVAEKVVRTAPCAVLTVRLRT